MREECFQVTTYFLLEEGGILLCTVHSDAQTITLYPLNTDFAVPPQIWDISLDTYKETACTRQNSIKGSIMSHAGKKTGGKLQRG